MTATAENELLQRITVRPDIFGGKPIVRDMRIAVEHILDMLAAGIARSSSCRSTRFSNRRTCRHAWCLPTARWQASRSMSVCPVDQILRQETNAIVSQDESRAVSTS